eukprot:TRINITY_DN750_c2_g1_i1.p1 TRINITY_DN750_c2_g1~~TRINITY_DN750_c2_g1_i1.p1  ORF type:complete len:226 (+),score=41.23 TRINITY_DN750_c2_g1_i1:69-680(+)
MSKNENKEKSAVFAAVAIVSFIIGLPVFVVYLLRWESSVDYENNSTVTTCKVLQVTIPGICTDKNNRQTGIRYAYNVATPLCDAVLYRADDVCNPIPLTVGTVKGCRVHDSCNSFKWKHQTTANMNSAFVGAAFLVLSMVCCFVGCAYYCLDTCHKDEPIEVVTIRSSPNPSDPDLDSPTRIQENKGKYCQPEPDNKNADDLI